MTLPRRHWLAYLFVLLFALLTAFETVSAQTYSFGQLYYPAGKQPLSIASGDLNNDGTQDLVVANLADNTVSVYLGKPDGTFYPAANFPTGELPYGVAVGDFNGDGNPDIAVTNENCTANGHISTIFCDAGSVSILLGIGDGTFLSQVQYATGMGPISVVARDLNADGKLDLIVVNNHDNSISVLLGAGDGTFATHVDYAAPSALCVVVADFNGDGRPDVAAGNAGGFSVWLGNGDGTLQNRADFKSRDQSAAVSLAAADFNGDGKQDLAVPSSSGLDIFLGNGDGTFTFQAVYASADGTPVAGDLNNDGKIDLVVLGTATTTGNPSIGVAVLLGNGDGTFKPAVNFASAGKPASAVALDLNGDGRLDLAVANNNCLGTGLNFPDATCGLGSITLLLGDGHGSLGAAPRNTDVHGANPDFLLQADLNGDQKPDLVVVNRGDDTISVLIGNGDGTFHPEVTYATGHQPVAVQASDLRGSGKVDLVVVNQICLVTSTTCAAGSVSVLLGNGDGTFQPHADVAVGVTPMSLAVADFNGDSKPDLAVTNANLGLGNTVSVLVGKGDGTFNPHMDYTVVNEPGPIVAADFNNDGKMDLAIACEDLANTQTCPAPLAFSILLGNGDATFQRHDFLTAANFSHGASSIAVADLNSDFNADLIAGDVTGSGFTVFLGKGDGTFQNGGSGVGNGVGTDHFAIGDFYGDTKLDVALAEEIPRIVISHGNGDGSFQAEEALMPPADPNFSDPIPIATDLNGDGGLDLAILQPGAGNIAVFLNEAARAVSPRAIDFHSQGLNTTGTQSINIANSGGAPFTVTGITISGASYTQVNVCVTKIMPGQSCSITVHFTPTTTGVSNGSVTITDSTGTSPQVIALTGMGVNGQFLQLSAAQLNFSPTTIGVPSQDQKVSFQNTGNAKLSVSNIDVSGANVGDFSLSGDPCTAIAPGDSCTRNVTFTPTAAGLRKASIVITDNAPGSPHTVRLFGTSIGAQVALIPSSLTFAAQAVGTTSAAQIVTMTNQSSTGVFITQVTASGDFKQTNNCGGSLNDGATCQISITFTPTAGGARSGTLTVAAGTGSPLTQTIPLSGTGADFSVATGSGGTSATVAAGATATYPLTLTGGSGFSGSVALTCSGAPTGATCSISPSSVTLSGTTPAATTVSVTTTAHSALFMPISEAPGKRTRMLYVVPGVITALALLTTLLLTVTPTGRRPRPHLAPLTLSLLPLILGVAVSGCGGGSNGSSSSPAGGTGTAAGNYTITVTATAGSGATAVSHTTKLTLVVQ